ncbi:Grap2 and cyclin-D-interacting-domain-containing protein [Paraphysoderma sedebokerense]|nr:Grap2 and cyclin-D-interacting-domain-containing protein [Paraphysoderma sedebokerense]
MAIESVPITCGATLKNEHKKCVSEIFLSLANLCNDFLPTEIKVPMSRCFPDFLISTGLVWNACDVFGKLSVHNKVAVSRRVEEALGILNDVIREMEEMVEEASQHVAENDCPNRNDDDKEKDSAADEGEKESSHDEMDDRMFSPNLTHNELQNTKKVLNLFKLTKLLFRKINARVVKLFPIRNYSNSPSASTSSTAESSRVSVSAHQTQPASLDHLVTPLPVLLDLFDELGVSLYSPQTVSTIRSQATKMTRVCIDLCHVCKTLIGEYECEDATEHVSWGLVPD